MILAEKKQKTFCFSFLHKDKVLLPVRMGTMLGGTEVETMGKVAAPADTPSTKDAVLPVFVSDRGLFSPSSACCHFVTLIVALCLFGGGVWMDVGGD